MAAVLQRALPALLGGAATPKPTQPQAKPAPAMDSDRRVTWGCPGVALVTVADSRNSQGKESVLGDTLCLVSAGFYAAYTIAIKLMLHEDEVRGAAKRTPRAALSLLVPPGSPGVPS
jgi:hypothetical protein